MIAAPSPLRLAAVSLGAISLMSLFSAPAASFLSALFGVLVAALVTSESKAMALIPLAHVAVCVASLYYLGEALLLGGPDSLTLGVVLSAVSLIMVYVEGKMLVLKAGVGRVGAAVVAIVLVVLLLTYSSSTRALEGVMEESLYGSIELVAYSGLVYVGASLPHSSAILFGLVYMVYDLLRSARPKEAIQTGQEAREVREHGVVSEAQ